MAAKTTAQKEARPGDDELAIYFAGDALWGDDFDEAQLDHWYADEAEGYADLGARDAKAYRYAYHAMNARYGFDHLPARRFDHVLAFGAAYGHELEPILPRVGRITVVDPSSAFAHDSIGGVPATYLDPEPSGRLPLASGEADLVTCLSTLHHIANVSTVLRELIRILAPGGYMLLREPIISMGDWRRPRPGLTKHERGIPLPILRSMVTANGLRVIRETPVAFPLTPRLFRWLRDDPYNSSPITVLDSVLCRLFAWNTNYHPRNAVRKLRPRAVFFVLRKE